MRNIIFPIAILLCLVSVQAAPALVSTDPIDSYSAFVPGDSIVFTFSENVRCGANCVISIMQNGAQIAQIGLTDAISANTVTIVPQLESDLEYSFVIAEGALENENGEAFAGTTLTLTTIDTYEPVLVSTYPANNGKIDLVDTIRLTFSKKIEANVNFTAILDCSDNNYDSEDPEVILNENTITLNVNLNSYTLCTLTIEAGGLQDEAGNQMSSPVILNFRSKDIIDPEMSFSLYPKDDINDADLKSDVIIKFDDQSHLETTGNGVIVMVCDYHTFEFTNYTLSVTDENIVTLYHQAEFDNGDHCNITIPAGFFADADGNPTKEAFFYFNVHEEAVEPQHPPLKCENSAFDDYLHRYPFKLHGLTYEQYIEEHREELEKSCYSYNWKTEQVDQPSDMTVFFDWTDNEMDKLGELSFGYNNYVQLYEEGELHKPRNHEVKRHRKVRQWMEEKLYPYCNKDIVCSTSWATSIVEVAESALDDKVEFSVEQLLDCLPEYYHMAEGGCKGVHPKTIEMYLHDVGLVKKSEFRNCKRIEHQNTYRFKIVKPIYPTATYLMDLIDENPNRKVFAMVALKTRKLRLVKDMMHAKHPYRCADYEPSTFGVVSGYKYDEENMDNSYWDIISHIVPCEEMSVRIPMSRNMTDANYAGISAFAFTLKPIN